MALTPEDKKDVKGAMGKALANKVSKVTKDYKPSLPSGVNFKRNGKGIYGGPKGEIPVYPRGHTAESWKKTKDTHARYDRDYKEGHKAEMAARKSIVPKHYRGNTNSEGGIPFGRKPK